MKVPNKGVLRGKNPQNLAFLSLFFKVKTKECDQHDWSVFDIFVITTHCSAGYFLEMGVFVSLKVATKASSFFI